MIRRSGLAMRVLFMVLVSLLPGCGAGAKACAVVDVAHESCKVVRYLSPDGTTEELTPDDLAKVAAAKKAARQQQAQVRP